MANGYTKLAGGATSGRLAITQYSLWLGPDHLLQIEKDGHTEKYRRFYFADIETFTIRRTNRQRNYAVIFGVILSLLLWMAIMAPGFGRGFAIFWMCFFGIPFVVNFVKGPSCVTHLSTAVQRIEIHSLRRIRAAERAFNELLNGSQATQGILSAEETQMRFQLRMAPPPISTPPLPTASPIATPPTEPPV